MNHVGTQRLETDRLVLRRYVRDDAQAMYRRCGFEGDDIWYICRKGETYDKEYSI